MKYQLKKLSLARHLLCLGLALPLPTLAAPVTLATQPLATSTTSSVKPNLLLVLDNSGSMAWDHMPDDASDAGSAVTFSFGYYGLRGSQCNQVYYDPAITYLAPVHPDGTSYPNASFTGAWDDGFNTGAGTVDLRTGFQASQSMAGDLSGQSAYYYSYSGAQATSLQKNYNSTTNTFYSECHSAQNASPGNGVFTKISLTSTAAATTATIVANCSSCTSTSVSGIKVNGTQEIMSGAVAASTATGTAATGIRDQINLCTSAKVGNCTTVGGHGYTASVSGGTVTLAGLAATATSLIVTNGNGGTMTFAPTLFPIADAANLQNFANWYSYYRTRMLMMKTATGRAFSSINKNYRVGLMKISSSSAPTIYVDTFWDNADTSLGPVSTHRTAWYNALYNTTESGSTPLRTALSDAGRYYGGKLSGADPIQYSCQQNFTLLSTDGYWNTGNGFKLDGSTAVGNQDGLLPRPFYDGSTLTSARSTSQTQMTQTQVRQSTSQTQKRTQQIQSASILRGAVSRVLLKCNNTSASCGTAPATGVPNANWAPATSCTNGAGTTAPRCARVTPSPALVRDVTTLCNTGGSINNNSPYTATNTDGGYLYSSCAYTAWSATTGSCTPVSQSATPNNTSVVAAMQCETDTGWVGAASCAPSSSGGQTVTCQQITTGPTLVSACSAASPASGNAYTTTTCASTTLASATPVASCTAAAAASSNNYTTTTCNTVTTGPTAGSCTAVAASALNNYTATTCTSVVSGGGTSDNLADIAAYYYQTDLRTPALLNCGTPAASGPLCENNVFLAGNDRNLQQHMTTFTLGLGASGWMNYSSSYLNDTGGDYVAVKNGSTADSTATPPACPWQANGTACNWPLPGMSGSNGLIANVDDLWHAAVNGHGAYFSATNPTTLSDGLSNALAGINARKGSAAAAATSTLNPVAGNNAAFVASYTTVAWKGNLEARGINTDTGQVNENANWCVENVPAGSCPTPGAVVASSSGATTTYSCVTPNSVICTGGTMNGTDCSVPVATSCTGTMNAKVSTASDTRTIKTANSTGAALIDFDAAYAAANSTNFNAAHISGLSQWSLLTPAQQAAAEGASLVNYLRGQYMYEDRTSNAVADRLYRYREAVLGDALESQPAFIGKPVFSYPYTGYSAYVTAQASRAGTVYMGANDGMMHAFAADTGIEQWAYVPSMVIPNMWMLADKNYSTLHRNFANGSPITSDIYCPGNCGGVVDAIFGDSASWRTILVAGLNGGGRGYFALDITDPVTPALLWEFTTTTGIGKVKDDDVGYSFGQPIITRKNDGAWVVLVTSGYNNISPGNGKGYLYVLNANTGAIISKISSGGVGSTATPSGLARIAGWNNEPVGNRVGYAYGGDLLGNVWRFDINSTTPPSVADGEIGNGDAFKFAVLYSEAAATNRQPITTTPTLGLINGKRVVFIGTGKYLEIGDLATTQIQTIYAIKDDDALATLTNPRTALVQQTLTNAGSSRTVSSNAVNFYTGRGWYVDLPDSGERVNVDSKLVQGTLLVPSIIPSSTACTPVGYGWLNFFNFQTGGAVAPTADPTSQIVSLKYDATIVGVNVLYVQGMPKVGVVTSNNPTPELNTSVIFSGSAAGFSGKRVIWRELLQ